MFIDIVMCVKTVREIIIETIEVGIEMCGGPATVASRFALKVLNNYKSKK